VSRKPWSVVPAPGSGCSGSDHDLRITDQRAGERSRAERVRGAIRGRMAKHLLGPRGLGRGGSDRPSRMTAGYARSDEGWRPHLVGRSPVFLHVVDLVERIAATDAPVLIEGETGTGKEVIARAIHYCSSPTRRDRPFIPVNCGAIPDSLIENEL